MPLTQITKLWARLEDDGSTSLAAILKSADFEEGAQVFIPDLSVEPTIENIFNNLFTLLNGGSLITYLLLDTFTDVNGTFIADHTPDIDTVGGGWVDYIYYGDEHTIEDNELTWEAAGVGESGDVSLDVGRNENLTSEASITAPVDAHANSFIATLSLSRDEVVGAYQLTVVFSLVPLLRVTLIKPGIGNSTVATVDNPMIWLDGETHIVKFSLIEGLLTGYIDDVEVISWQEDAAPATGTFVAYELGASYMSPASLDNVSVVEESGDTYVGLLAFDLFQDTNGTPIEDHTPNLDINLGGWQESIEAGDGATIEDNDFKLGIAESSICAINVGVSNLVSAGGTFISPSDAHDIGWFVSVIVASISTIPGYEARFTFNAGTSMTVSILRDSIEKASVEDTVSWPGSTWHRIAMRNVNGLITVYFDGLEVLTWLEDDTALTGTSAGFFIDASPVSPILVDSFFVRDIS